MRLVAPLLLTVIAAISGCASSSSDDGTSSSEADSAASGTACKVAYEDANIVVFRAPNNATSYVPKTLHVVDVKVTPATANLPADLQNTRFAQNHVAYVLGARTRPDALARLNQLIGPGTQAAPVSFDATTAGVTTSVAMASPSYLATDSGTSITADLTDSPSGALVAGATKKATLSAAHVTANVSCGGGTMQVAMSATNPVTFDAVQAKIFAPGDDLSAVDTFLSMSSQIKNGSFSSETTKLNSPDLVTKLTAFAATVDETITPILTQYGVTMARADVQAAINTTWQAYLGLAQTVLDATQATVNASNMQTLNADGTYNLAPGLSSDAQALLATANAARKNVETVMAETGTGYATQNLQ